MYSGNMCLQIAHVRFFQFYKFWVLDRVDDDGMKEMYLSYMLIYMGEYTDEVLDRCSTS